MSETQSEQKYSDEELLGWIQSFVECYGLPPATRDIDGWPGPATSTYRCRFGTLSAAIREAGYEPRGDVDD